MVLPRSACTLELEENLLGKGVVLKAQVEDREQRLPFVFLFPGRIEYVYDHKEICGRAANIHVPLGNISNEVSFSKA